MPFSRRTMMAGMFAVPAAMPIAWPALAQRAPNTHAASQFALDLCGRICRAVGLSQNFSVMAGDVSAAEARLIGADRQIIYNEDWLRQVQLSTGSSVPVLVTLAHEIGHHLNGHTLDPIPADVVPPDGLRFRLREELEADLFAGGITARLGYAEAAGLPAFAMTSLTATVDHPSRLERQNHYKGGWDAAPRPSRCVPDAVVAAPPAVSIVNVYSHSDRAQRIQSQFKGTSGVWHEYQNGTQFAEFTEEFRDPCGRIMLYDKDRGVWVRLTPSATGFGLGEFGTAQGVAESQVPTQWAALNVEDQMRSRQMQRCSNGKLI